MMIVVLVGCVTFTPSCSTSNDTRIIDNGKAQYAVVYSTFCSDDVRTAADRIIDGIFELTGVSLPVVDEQTAFGAPDNKYIIVGDSVFPESAEVKSTLSAKADAYAIEQTETGNIVLVANYDSGILAAAEHYVKSLISENYSVESGVLTFEGCYFDGTDTLPAGFNIADLNDTKIVYATNLDGYQIVAETLQNAIRDVYHIDVPVYADTEKGSSAREILIGQTNRELSSTYYADKAYVMEYNVIAYRGSLQIACGGSLSARKAVDYLNSSLFTAANSSKKLSQGSYTSKKLSGSAVPITSGANVRIMTLNIMPYILGESAYANILPVRERAEIFAGMLINYTPDVIGFQEFDFKWQEQMPHYIDVLNEYYDLGYELVFSSYNGDNNYSPMMYRADKYTAIECKYQMYDYHKYSAESNGYYIRGAAQLVLQSKNNASEKFVVVNSHWDHGGQTTTANPQYMNECASSEAAIVNAYKAKYPDARIFCTGDFNSHRYNETYLKQFCNDIGGTVASSAAKSAGTLIVAGGYHASDATKILEDQPRSYSSGGNANVFIDHIVFTCGNTSKTTQVVRHDTIYQESTYCHVLSDHSPVYADFKFVN